MVPANWTALSEADLRDARCEMREGYVTKVNQLNIANVTNNPAVIEDVEWNNGGRGKKIKLLSGLYIYEFFLSVINKSNYKKYEPVLDHTIVSF